MLATGPVLFLLPDLFRPALAATFARWTQKFLKGLPLTLPESLLESNSFNS